MTSSRMYLDESSDMLTWHCVFHVSLTELGAQVINTYPFAVLQQRPNCMAVGYALLTVMVVLCRYSRIVAKYSNWTFYYSTGLMERKRGLFICILYACIYIYTKLTSWAHSVNSDLVMSSSSRFIVITQCNVFKAVFTVMSMWLSCYFVEMA